MILRKLQNDNVDDIIGPLLDDYEQRIKDWKKDLSLKGKNIQIANVQQASYLAYYDEVKVNLKSLLNYYEMEVKRVRSECVQFITKQSQYEYTFSEKEKMVDRDPKYLKYKKIYLQVSELYDMLNSISEQFKSRAYTLNNLVKIYAASLQDITLDE